MADYNWTDLGLQHDFVYPTYKINLQYTRDMYDNADKCTRQAVRWRVVETGSALGDYNSSIVVAVVDSARSDGGYIFTLRTQDRPTVWESSIYAYTYKTPFATHWYTPEYYIVRKDLVDSYSTVNDLINIYNNDPDTGWIKKVDAQRYMSEDVAARITWSNAPEVTDNEDNSFTVNAGGHQIIDASSSAHADSNTVVANTSRWWYSDTPDDHHVLSMLVSTRPLTIKDTDDTRTIVTETKLTLKHGDPFIISNEYEVKQLIAPSAPTLSVIETSETAAAPSLKLSWSKSSPTNNNSSLKGYRIIWNKAFYSDDNTTIEDYQYIDSTNVSSSLSLVDVKPNILLNTFKLKPGDLIQIMVEARTETGEGDETDYSGNSLTSCSNAVEYNIPGPLECTTTITDLYQNKFTAEAEVTYYTSNQCKVPAFNLSYLNSNNEFVYSSGITTGSNSTILVKPNKYKRTWTQDIDLDLSVIPSNKNFDFDAATVTTGINVDLQDSYNTTYEDGTAAKADIRNYRAPKAIANISLSRTFDSNGPLFTCSWDAAEETNTTSPVVGYKFALIKKASDGRESYIDELQYSADTTEVSFYPKDLGLSIGEQFTVEIQPYTKFGEDNDGDILDCTTNKKQSDITKVPGGIVHIKVTDGWKEGEVYVCVGKDENNKSIWKAADCIYVKTSNGWKESI